MRNELEKALEFMYDCIGEDGRAAYNFSCSDPDSTGLVDFTHPGIGLIALGEYRKFEVPTSFEIEAGNILRGVPESKKRREGYPESASRVYRLAGNLERAVNLQKRVAEIFEHKLAGKK
ncbi:hypothetical protein HN832_02895 [archaeon]|jgi:hypothetical protein|nr:hypothetical protein [archaeon]MBT4373303.1 hypothetical protein [archaeon]MBT4531648.1 hypothetical protein [archaeon]MBT7001174.1 hypothetical protein [archaeon]MBT7282340.1 hypothetical protein [archaeon]